MKPISEEELSYDPVVMNKLFKSEEIEIFKSTKAMKEVAHIIGNTLRDAFYPLESEYPDINSTDIQFRFILFKSIKRTNPLFNRYALHYASYYDCQLFHVF